MTNVAFTEYANKILDISGEGVVDEYFNYSRAYYTMTNNSALFLSAWQDMKDSETVLFDIPLTLAAPNQDMGWIFNFDLYVDVGADGQLQALYDACANETIPPPVDNYTRDVYYINNVATFYGGEASGLVNFPIPIYTFGDLWDGSIFFIGDLTPLSMGLGLILAKIVNVSIPDNNITIQQGFEFENESGIIIPDSVTIIGDGAFSDWDSNNQPLVIPNSVTSIGDSAFNSWTSNNQPLVIPNSVTSIGDSAFYNWLLVPYIEIQSLTPPSLASSGAFNNQNNAPIYVPDASVTAYKTATNWASLASRIFPISDK